jgi:hypothetical protein
MIRKLSVDLKSLKKQLDLVNSHADYLQGCRHDEESAEMLDGLANFLSALNEALVELQPGGSVEVSRGKE